MRSQHVGQPVGELCRTPRAGVEGVHRAPGGEGKGWRRAATAGAGGAPRHLSWAGGHMLLFPTTTRDLSLYPSCSQLAAARQLLLRAEPQPLGALTHPSTSPPRLPRRGGGEHRCGCQSREEQRPSRPGNSGTSMVRPERPRPYRAPQHRRDRRRCRWLDALHACPDIPAADVIWAGVEGVHGTGSGGRRAERWQRRSRGRKAHVVLLHGATVAVPHARAAAAGSSSLVQSRARAPGTRAPPRSRSPLQDRASGAICRSDRVDAIAARACSGPRRGGGVRRARGARVAVARGAGPRAPRGSRRSSTA